MIAKNPNDKERKSLVPILAVLALVVAIGVVLVFVIPAINKGKKSNNSDSVYTSATESAAVTEENSSEDKNTTDSEDSNTENNIDSSLPDEKESKVDDYDDKSGDHFNLLIKNEDPLTKENFDDKFAKDDDEEEQAKVDDYVVEYTNYKATNFFNLLSAICNTDGVFEEFSLSEVYSNAFRNGFAEDRAVVCITADEIPLYMSDIAVEYANFVYSHIEDDYSIFACKNYILTTNKSDLFCNNVERFSNEDALKKTYYLYSIEQFISNGTDWENHSYEWGVPSKVETVFNNCIPEGASASYVVPVKDLTNGSKIVCYFDSGDNLIGMTII